MVHQGVHPSTKILFSPYSYTKSILFCTNRKTPTPFVRQKPISADKTAPKPSFVHRKPCLASVNYVSFIY